MERMSPEASIPKSALAHNDSAGQAINDNRSARRPHAQDKAPQIPPRPACLTLVLCLLKPNKIPSALLKFLVKRRIACTTKSD